MHRLGNVGVVLHNSYVVWTAPAQAIMAAKDRPLWASVQDIKV